MYLLNLIVVGMLLIMKDFCSKFERDQKLIAIS